MAPPPEYDKEPKAPDKSVTSDNCEETKTIGNSSSEQFTNSDSKSHNNVTNTDVENNTHVGTLDDGQLRALLDEAITYKCPKDREGKSSLFKELLEEVEQDEQACEAAARELTGSRGKRAGKGRRQLPHSNSLQDLVAALAAESAPRRARAVPVSTRAIHGGSLPSGVDTTFLLSEEPHRGYLATVRCVNPPPLAERAAEAPAAPSAPPAPSTDACHRRSKPTTGVTYTARATLEIGGGRAVTTTTASNQVDSAIPFNCITTPEVVASCNTTSTTQSAATVDPKPLQLGSCYRAVASLTGPPAPPALPPQNNNHNDESATSPGMNGLPMSRASDDEYKKSLDENGNSVGGVSPSAGGKKQRRKRSSRNETVTKSHHIDGYQGNKDLNELLRFIEASAPPRPRRKPPPDPRDKKRRRKPSTGVLQRAASLESVAAPPDPPPPEPEPEPSAAGFTTVSRRRRSRRKNLSPSPPPEPKIEKTVTVNSGVNVTVNVKPVVVPDLIESHRVCVSKPAPPARRPDVLTARRAPVQLPRAPPPPPGLRFGFDVNETLLPPASPPSPPSPPPPARAAPPPHVAALVDYIGHAWEDVIKCLGGKVRYYSE